MSVCVTNDSVKNVYIADKLKHNDCFPSERQHFLKWESIFGYAEGWLTFKFDHS